MFSVIAIIIGITSIVVLSRINLHNMRVDYFNTRRITYLYEIVSKCLKTIFNTVYEFFTK